AWPADRRVGLPESAPPSRPPVAAAEGDLSDAEFAELGELLAAVPEPLQPLSLDMADGFLAGIAVQPSSVEPGAWLRFVFDEEGHRWGEAEPAPEQRRASVLLQRRLAAIERQLVEFRGFDPFLFATAEPAPEVPGTVAVVAPWVAGFFVAVDQFPLNRGDDDEAVAATLAGLERYLEEAPTEVPANVDAAVGEIVDAVALLRQRAERLRFGVAPLRRSEVKVGRNDACPCGSGVKFKRCHGRGDAA
ncbi:MAG: UPF0149 family protein, partial [Pseudomonadota bacterium]|nr:UPF0149 family protein [Pseudomonadota bacterium]